MSMSIFNSSLACDMSGMCRRVFQVMLRFSSSGDRSSLQNWNHPGHFFFSCTFCSSGLRYSLNWS
jgi:hypothetical protein